MTKSPIMLRSLALPFTVLEWTLLTIPRAVQNGPSRQFSSSSKEHSGVVQDGESLLLRHLCQSLTEVAFFFACFIGWIDYSHGIPIVSFCYGEQVREHTVVGCNNWTFINILHTQRRNSNSQVLTSCPWRSQPRVYCCTV